MLAAWSPLRAVLWGTGDGVQGTLNQRRGLGGRGAANRLGLRPLRPKLAALTEHGHVHRCSQEQTEESGASLPPPLTSHPASSGPGNRFADSAAHVREQGTGWAELRATVRT